MDNKNSIAKALPVLFGFFVMGFCDIVGISSDYAKEAFGWSNATAGFVPSMVFIWFLFLSIPAGIKMNSWGRKNTVLLSMAITIAGMAVPVVAYNSTTCMTAYALLGIGNAILQVSLNPLLNNVVTDRKLLTSSLTAGQVVKALSSLAGPHIVLIAINIFGHGDTGLWYYSFPILGAITLLSAMWLMLTPIEREPTEETRTGTLLQLKETLMLLSDKRLLILMLGIFFAVGIDVSTNFISSKLMSARYGWSKEEAGAAPQIYFFCRTVGALAGTFIMTRISEIKYFRANITLCIAVLLLLAAVENTVLNITAIGAVGFLCSCIFPILFSEAVQTRPDKTNQISGLAITAVSGGAVVPPAVGLAVDTAGIAAGVAVLLVSAIYLTFCAFAVKPHSTGTTAA